MNAPPALMAALIPAGLFAAWLFLHKDADIEQRIDKKEAVQKLESAEFDRDFARMTSDSEGAKRAEIKITNAEKKIEITEKVKENKDKKDQRIAVRNSIDDFLTPDSEQKK